MDGFATSLRDTDDPTQKPMGLQNIVQAPANAPPSLGPLPALAGPAPDMASMGGLKPIVTNPRQQLEQSLQEKMSAFQNPAKPQGFWQKLGHALAQNPYSMSYRNTMEDRRSQELAGLKKQDVDAQNAASDSTLRGAQAGEATARTQAIENPVEKSAWKVNPDYIGPNGEPIQENEATGEMRIAQGLPAGVRRYEKPIKGESPTEDLQQQISDAEAKGDTATAKQLQQRLKDLNPQAEQRFSFDMGKEGDSADRQDVQTRKAIYATYQPVMDSAERFNVMSRNYEDAVKNHDQQAMLSLLYNHMGMTMGLQKGARMTQALIKEAQKSQPWLQGMEAKFDKDGYLTGVTLSPTQMQEMVHNAQGRYSEDVTKARNEAGYLGAKDDGPDRTPNSSTINYYINLANGDAAKAKQLAEQDGWKVK